MAWVAADHELSLIRQQFAVGFADGSVQTICSVNPAIWRTRWASSAACYALVLLWNFPMTMKDPSAAWMTGSPGRGGPRENVPPLVAPWKSSR